MIVPVVFFLVDFVVVQAESDESCSFPEIPVQKVAFIALSSIRLNQDHYDLKLLKRKHVQRYRYVGNGFPEDAVYLATKFRSHPGPKHNSQNRNNISNSGFSGELDPVSGLPVLKSAPPPLSMSLIGSMLNSMQGSSDGKSLCCILNQKCGFMIGHIPTLLFFADGIHRANNLIYRWRAIGTQCKRK